MKATFECKDLGMACDFKAEAGSKDELMPKIVEHAKTAHGMETIDEEMKGKVVSAIKVL